MTESTKKMVRAANYLAGVQMYLQDNFLLEQPLKPEHIKPRVLGHWGSVPGITFTYAQLNCLIKKHSAKILFVLGPGHGYPGLRAQLFIEGTLAEFFPEQNHSYDGIGIIARSFSWPYGSPSHANPGTPGAIVEGGELGYSLATAFGSVLDNPDLITACLVGDGEAETGPIATAWHANKFLDPVTNGAVLPILHLNGYKISGPTIFGRMSDKELKALFTGYGYEPLIVQFNNKIYEKAAEIFELAYQKIRAIQQAARNGGLAQPPRWPMIILKTPKGWTGVKSIGGLKIEGNYASHQVVYQDARTNKTGLKAIEKWLRSYKFEELFSKEQGFIPELKAVIPEGNLRMGMNPHAYSGKQYRPLNLPSGQDLAVPLTTPGKTEDSSMERLGEFLRSVFELNHEQKNFRFMSPDETYSNKLDAIFKATGRAFVWPQKAWDKDLAQNGRVMEMLSEHTLEGMLEGYILTGRHAAIDSYEAFIQVIASMADQHVKFLKAAQEFPWRGDIAAATYILTSPGWRQDHNGYTHQNPGFINGMLEKHVDFVDVYFPADANTTLAVADKAFRAVNRVNIIAAGKTKEPQWRTLAEAQADVNRGIAIWQFASQENPDIVFCGIGDYATKEALAAIALLRRELPQIRTRFVSIVELTTLGIGRSQHPLNKHELEQYFTPDKPVIINFHGYPATVEHALYRLRDPRLVTVNGYRDQGSTTTPFDMQTRNGTSRYHLIMQAAAHLKLRGVIAPDLADSLIANYKQKLTDHKAYIIKHGEDPQEITQWQWDIT